MNAPPPSTNAAILESDAARASSSAARLRKVEARDVTKMFGSTPALRGANLQIESGEIVLLCGPNGAGKSTLLGILGTQLKATRGRVLYESQNGGTLKVSDVREQVGWVSHESHCYAELTGKQNIELAAELQGLPLSTYEAVAERLNLGAFARRAVSTLSRGQTQRIALGRALIHRPSLLLLDEPWTGLDQKSSQLLTQVVEEESARGALVVIVSHEEGLAARLGAREVQVLRGQTV